MYELQQNLVCDANGYRSPTQNGRQVINSRLRLVLAYELERMELVLSEDYPTTIAP